MIEKTNKKEMTIFIIFLFICENLKNSKYFFAFFNPKM